MPTIKKIMMLLIFIILLFLISCKEIPKRESKILSELQVTACYKADEAGTCNTRLSEVGIVLKEDCCKILGKCC